MLIFLVSPAYAMGSDSDVCAAELVVVATVESLIFYRRQGGGVRTLATFGVDRTIVGQASWPLQARYHGGEMDGYIHDVSGAPRLSLGERYLLAFRVGQIGPSSHLVSWDYAPADIDLPDEGMLHFAWDTMCATGPVRGLSIDHLRGVLERLHGRTSEP